MNAVNLFEIFVMSWVGPPLTLVFILLNIVSFAIFLFGNEDTKIKYNKIFKFIEPISFIHSTMFLFLASFIFYFTFIRGNPTTFFMYFICIIAIIFTISNLLGLISYIILRFLSMKKLELSIKKFSCFFIIISILVNLISTILLLITTPSLIFVIYTYLPISASILYLKTLLIVKDDL